MKRGTASADPLAVSPPCQRIVAFTGSAIAAGWLMLYGWTTMSPSHFSRSAKV